MKYDEFIGHVQNRARVATTEEAVRATRATLQTLSERLHHDEADDLAAQLPEELGVFLRDVESDERFAIDEFFRRVAEREGIDEPDAVYHVRAVISVLQDAVSPGELADVRTQLPDSYAPIFDAGTEGEMETT